MSPQFLNHPRQKYEKRNINGFPASTNFQASSKPLKIDRIFVNCYQMVLVTKAWLPLAIRNLKIERETIRACVLLFVLFLYKADIRQL